MIKPNSIGLVSGGFDPIHSGHLALIRAASDGNEELLVAVNSNEWLERKKGSYFLPWEERAAIVRSLALVDAVFEFDDSDDSACEAIETTKMLYPNHTIVFYNGGDRSASNTLEMLKYATDPQVELRFAAGGDEKLNASSDILQTWMEKQHQTTIRDWGQWDVLLEHRNSKVKTLCVKPGQSLSMQKHTYRNEHWFVAEGSGLLEYQTDVYAAVEVTRLSKHSLITIPNQCWHKLFNNTNSDLCIIEIQFGAECVEADIKRRC